MAAQQFPPIELPPNGARRYYVYILQSADGALYVGQSTNVSERLRKHRFGLGSKHTRDHGGAVLIYVEDHPDLASAVAREAQLKRWSTAKKEALIRGDHNRLHELSR